MKLGIITFTNRAHALGMLAESLRHQTRRPDSVHVVYSGDAVGESAPDGWVNVPYEDPGFYAIEMAANAAADASMRAGADLLVFVSDLSCLEPDALEWMERYMLESGAPLVQAQICLHYAIECSNRLMIRDIPASDLALSSVGSGWFAGPVAHGAHLVFMHFAGVRADVWALIGGWDERFAGANGYSDSDVARRIELATGTACHVHTGLKVHRLDHRLLPKAKSSRRPLFSTQRNIALYKQLCASGGCSAYRFYAGAQTPLPQEDYGKL